MPSLEKALCKLRRSYRKRFPQVQVSAEILGRSVRLSGDAPDIRTRYEIGVLAAERLSLKGLCRGIVNDLSVAGKTEEPPSLPQVSDSSLEGRHFDVAIVGAGVIGCAIARELSRYQLDIAVLEKEADVAMQASGRNDGMIHPGFADSPKKIKGKINARANAMYQRVADELGFEIQWRGSIMLFRTPLLILLVPYMKLRCRKNGVRGRNRYVSRKEVEGMEPNIRPFHWGGFYMPSAGIASPFKVTLAFAENAAQNGVSFFFDTAVLGMKTEGGRVRSLRTNRGEVSAEIVINAAGVWADRIAEMARDRFFSIHPRKGTDLILDRRTGAFLRTCLAMPDLMKVSKGHTKGGGLIPCIEGNVLVGPTSEEVFDREDFSTSPRAIEELQVHLDLKDELSREDTITYYSGVRAATWEEDFIIEASETVENLIHAAGLQSPGFASAPAIAEDVAGLAIQRLRALRSVPQGEAVPLRPDFDPIRRVAPNPQGLEEAELRRLIARDPAYGRIVCRCEGVSEGEIRDAVHSLIGAATVDAVKRRIRAGAGRCHGGFCLPRVMEIIAREREIGLGQVEKNLRGSTILVGELDEVSDLSPDGGPPGEGAAGP